MNQPIFGELVVWPLGYAIQFPKISVNVFCIAYEIKRRPPISSQRNNNSQPGPLFFCRIGEFISLRIVLWPTATTITWVQLNQNTTSTFQHIRKFYCLQSLWLTLTFASKKYFKLKDAFMHCFDWCFWQDHLFSVHWKNRDKHLFDVWVRVKFLRLKIL